MAAKRADYFEAGTKVVWDVDPEAELIQCYRARRPTTQRCPPLGKPLMPSPPSPVGACPSTGSLHDGGDWLGNQRRGQSVGHLDAKPNLR